MPRLRLGMPFWVRSPAFRTPRVRYPALRRDVSADVAIVGGGVTGVTIAWRFAQAGLRVALLEAAHIGRGSTAASTALLMQEPDEDYATLARRYGEKRTRRIWQLSRLATRDFITAIRDLDIACHLAERDSIYYTVTPDAAARLQREHRRRRNAGITGRWLDAAALLDETGIHGEAALRTHGNAQIDPYKACLGFAHVAAKRDAMIFERSRVERIKVSRDDVTAFTGRGSVRADNLIVATGYATRYFKPLLVRFKILNTYVVVTRPLTASERRRLGLGAVMLWDTERPYHYSRWTHDHRLMLGGADRAHVGGRVRARALREGTKEVRESFTSLYPMLADIEHEYAWEGLFARTSDGLPYIGPHRRYPRQLFALGYGGNGMTFGFLASRLLLDWYRGTRTSDHDLFAFGRL